MQETILIYCISLGINYMTRSCNLYGDVLQIHLIIIWVWRYSRSNCSGP